MRTLILLALFGPGAHADGLSAVINITEHLSRQGARVGACADVAVRVISADEIDGSYQYYVAVYGRGADGQPFQLSGKFGGGGSSLRVMRRAPGEYLMYVATPALLGFGHRRDPVITLRTDPQGKTILDLVAPSGQRLCTAGEASRPAE